MEPDQEPSDATAMSSELRPAIVAVDNDDEQRDAVRDELDDRYSRDYAIIVERTVDDAWRALESMAASGQPVALVLADRRSGGAELLAAVRDIHRQARRGLLLDFWDTRRYRRRIAEVIGRGDADYFLAKPRSRPDERFHRDVSEFLDEWWRVAGLPYEAVQVVGDENAPRSHEIADLLQRHDYPYGFYPSGSAAGRELLARAGLTADRLPVVFLPDGRALVDPTSVEIADGLGARTKAGSGTYDVVVVGGGPAGLAAAVYAGSEGLRTALIEPVAMGGQAGTSSMIKNYLGFPRGISGTQLAARAFEQALLFGTDMVYGSRASSLLVESDERVVVLSDGNTVRGRTVVVATGVSYRTLDVAALERFNGVSVFYGAAVAEARTMSGEQVYVVGGGNSAGQAALHLAHFAENVTVLVRSDSLARSMSDYLVRTIESTDGLDIRFRTEVVGAASEGTRLQTLDLKDLRTGDTETVTAAGLFVLIGGYPHTDWLPPTIERDAWGYLVTGRRRADATDGATPDALPPPLPLETTMPGVFAVGDVRSGSIKRVASAVGEGSVCVRLIHDYLEPSA